MAKEKAEVVAGRLPGESSAVYGSRPEANKRAEKRRGPLVRAGLAWLHAAHRGRRGGMYRESV